MKKFALIVIALLILATMANAGEYQLTMRSNYVGCDSGSVFFPGRVIQGCGTFQIGGGNYVGVWGSHSLEAEHGKPAGNEIDLFAGRASKIGQVKTDVGVNYYNLAPLERFSGDLVAIYANFNFRPFAHGIRPIVHIEYDIGTDHRILPSGLIYHFSFRKNFGKTDVGFNIGGHPSAFGVRAEPVSFIALDATEPVTKHDSIYVRFQKGTGKANGLTRDVATVGVNHNF